MKKNAIIGIALVLLNGYALAADEAATVNLSFSAGPGIINTKAKFSISETEQVYFSQGNLQYTTTGTHLCADGTTQPGTWRFAEHQYDTIGVSHYRNGVWEGNKYASPTYTGWIDVFGWGTSGWNSGAQCYMPYSITGTHGDYLDFCPRENEDACLSGEYANADWGIYNAISNGGNKPGMWRTLTNNEWKYLYDSRSADKVAAGVINDVEGWIFLPDDWVLPAGLTFYPGTEIRRNVYTIEQWTQMEEAGALFLPVYIHAEFYNNARVFKPVRMGICYLPDCSTGGNYYDTYYANYGIYWSSDSHVRSHAKVISFEACNGKPWDVYTRANYHASICYASTYTNPALSQKCDANAVRLVTIGCGVMVPNAEVTPTAGGAIEVQIDTCQQFVLKAVPNSGYIFRRWEDDSMDDVRYVDYLEGNYTAYFTPISDDIQIVAYAQDTLVFTSALNMTSYSLYYSIGSRLELSSLSFRRVDAGIYYAYIPSLQNHAGELLSLQLKQGNTEFAFYQERIPNIVVGSQTSNQLLPNADIWVCPQARLTIDDEGLVANRVYIHADGKIIVPTHTQLAVNMLSLRGGARISNTYRFSNPQLYVDGTLINHNNDTIYYDYLINDQQWYALGLPATAQVGDIRYLSGQTAEGQFAIETYNGQTRSTRSYIHAAAWENMTGSELKAGTGYNIFAHPEKVEVGGVAQQRQCSRLRIPMYLPMPNGEPQAATIAVTAFGNDNPQAIPEDRGWNFIANPYLSNYNGWLTQEYIPINYVTIPSNDGQSYTQEYIEDVSVCSFRNCFVQVEENKLLTFHREARSRKAARTASTDEQRLRLILGDAIAQDKVGIRLSNRYTHQYEINADLLKFDHADLSAYVVGDQHLAFAALPMDNREIALGYSASRAGRYTWALNDKDLTTAFKHIYLYDRETNQMVDLLQEDYAFDTEAMTNDQRFVVRAVATTTTTTTTTTTERDCLDFANLYSDHVVCSYTDTYSSFEKIGVVDRGWNNILSRHTVMTDTTAVDLQTGGLLRVIPQGATQSVRLGNWGAEAESETITYNYTVDAAENGILILRYAAVLQYCLSAGTETVPYEKKPAFTVAIKDGNNQPIGDCGNFTYVSEDGTTANWHYTLDGGEGIAWCEWTSVGIDLTPYDGQTIQIQLKTKDCGYNIHFGYAYYTLSCIPREIDASPCMSTAEGKTLTAPDDFNYQWYKVGEATSFSSEQSVVVSAQASYRCEVSAKYTPDCKFNLYADAKEYFPKADFSIQRSNDQFTLLNLSQVLDAQGEEVYGVPLVWYEWNFGDGTMSDEFAPAPHTYAESGVYDISLVMHIGQHCTDTMTRSICYGGCDYMRSDTICPGDSVLFDGRYISRNGEYMATYTGQFGFDSIVHEYLYYWPTYGTTYGEMTTADVDAPAPVANTPATNWAEPFVPIIPDDYDTICSGETYTWHGKQFTQSGTYYDTLSTILHGCDSIVTLHLTVSAVPTTQPLDTTVCDTLLPYKWYGRIYYGPATYTDTLHNSRGCDSLYRSYTLDTIHCVRPEPPVPPEPECGDSLVYRKWDDVLFCDDGLRQFIAYQWYRDEQMMSGETNQYLYLPGGQMGTASYGVVATRRDGSRYASCSKPFYDWPRSADTYVQVQTIVRRGGALRIDMSDPCAEVEIYSTLGQRVLSASITGPQYSLPIYLPAGAYVLRLQGDRASALTKILVE